MALTVLNGPNIAPGESLSDVLDCTAGDVVRLTMPAEWDNAALTFQGSTDNVGFNDLYDAEGSEIRIVARAGVGILLSATHVQAIGYLKIRSGTAEDPVPQSGIRTFAVTLHTP